MEKIIKRLSKISVAFALIFIFLLEIRKGYFRNFHSYLESLHLKFYGMGIVMTGILFAGALVFDQTLYDAIHKIDSPFFQQAARFGGLIGRNINFWYGVIAIYVVNLFFRKKNRRTFAFGLLISGMLSGLVTQVVKIIFSRARPEALEGAYSFFNLRILIDHNNLFMSLPSGDVTLVAGASSFLFFMFKQIALRWLVFLLPLFTAFSRILTESHWPSDTVLGFGIGIMAGKFISDFHRSGDFS